MAAGRKPNIFSNAAEREFHEAVLQRLAHCCCFTMNLKEADRNCHETMPQTLEVLTGKATKTLADLKPVAPSKTLKGLDRASGSHQMEKFTDVPQRPRRGIVRSRKLLEQARNGSPRAKPPSELRSSPCSGTHEADVCASSGRKTLTACDMRVSRDFVSTEPHILDRRSSGLECMYMRSSEAH